MISLPGSGYPVGGGVRAADDGRRIIIPGKAASESEVFGVWGEYGVGVSVSLSKYSAHEGSGRETVLGDHSPRQRDKNIQDGFPNCGGPKELPRRGMSGMGRDPDGNMGQLSTPACTGYRDNTT